MTKIYNKLVINIATGEIVYEDSFEYSGPMVECKGGGGSSTTTIDPVYNAGMLALFKEQEGWARQMFSMFQYGVNYDPSETVRGAYIDGKWTDEANIPGRQQSNPAYITLQNEIKGLEERVEAGAIFEVGGGGMSDRRLKRLQRQLEQKRNQLAMTNRDINVDSDVKIISTTRGEIEGYDPDAQTSEMEYMQNVVAANQSLLGEQTELEFSQMGLSQDQIASMRSLLPGQTALSKLQASDTMAGIKERAPVRSKFFDEALEGVDAKERMNLAQADVARSFAGAEGTARRSAARMGLNPANIDFSGMATERAKGIGLARTTARTGAKDESFRRLQSAMGV